jgi:tight adherence protein B
LLVDLGIWKEGTMQIPALGYVEPIYLAFGIGIIFLLIILVILIARKPNGEPDLNDRLSQFAGRQDIPQAPEEKTLEKIDAVVRKKKFAEQTARDLAKADLKLTVTEFFGLKLLAALVGAGIGGFVGRASPLAIIISALVGFIVFSFIPNIYVGMTAKRRMKDFNNQLGDSINMLANALRSGYSFLQSMELVSREAPAPTAGEFRRVVQEVGLGLSTAEALGNLLKRMPSDDLDLLITAVNIQMEVGGNLAQILETIGHTIRERVRIKGEIQVLTAQGRISAYVITALPIFLAIFITMMNPNYMAPIFTFGFPPEAWCCLPVAALTMIVIGFVAIMKIVDIEV